MTDEQRSLAGYKSKVHTQEDFQDPNVGKPVLDDVTEYVFRLKEIPRLQKKEVTKKRKDNSEVKVMTDRAIVVFVEEKTLNEVATFFRVDALNFDPDGTYESAIITFFKKIKAPLPEGQDVDDWSIHFVTGMRIRGRVAVKANTNPDTKEVTYKYFLDVPTIRPILLSDKNPEAIQSTIENTAKSNATLANAKFLAKGAKNYSEAEDMLKKASAETPLLVALFEANANGTLVFPI